MFEDSIFESAGKIHTRSRRWMIVTFLLNTSVLAALILIPLLCPQALPRLVNNLLMEPLLLPVEQPKPIMVTAGARPSTAPDYGVFVAPRRIPIGVQIPSVPEQPVVIGFYTMGPSDHAENLFPTQSGPRIVHPDVGTIRVPSTIEEGLLIRKTLPVYPPIARAAQIEGTVRLAATISKTGAIENLRVTSGPRLLQQAALDAVESWRYRPYLLNGLPVEVETTVDVIFTLNR